MRLRDFRRHTELPFACAFKKDLDLRQSGDDYADLPALQNNYTGAPCRPFGGSSRIFEPVHDSAQLASPQLIVYHPRMLHNALTIDVEDYFNVTGFARWIDPAGESG